MRNTHFKLPRQSVVFCNFKCSFKVPDEIVMSDSIRVAIWNDEKQSWVEDGLTEYTYTESSRTFQFYSTVVGIIALVKDRIADFPYKKW